MGAMARELSAYRCPSGVLGGGGGGGVLADRSLYGVLGRYFSPDVHGDAAARAVRVCFVAFAAVFARPDSPRPWVPISAARRLWEGVLLGAERAAAESVPERMEVLGLVEGDAVSFRVRHDLMLRYAAQSLRVGDSLDAGRMSLILKARGFTAPSESFAFKLRKRATGKKKPSAADPTPTKIIEQLNLFYALVCIAERDEKPGHSWDVAISDDPYIYEFLPHHMVQAGRRKMYQKALALLSDDGFIRGRMTSLGIERGTKASMTDIEMIHSAFQRGPAKKGDEAYLKDAILMVVNALTSYMKKRLPALMSVEDPSRPVEEIALAFDAIGTSLQHVCFWAEALDVFAYALEIFKTASMSEDHPAVKRTRLHLNASALPVISLVPRSSPQRIELKHAARLRELADGGVGGGGDGDGDVARASASAGTSEERDGVPLELSSHPDLAAVALMTQAALGCRYRRLAVGPGGSALRLRARGDRLCAPRCGGDGDGDGAVLTYMTPPREGGPVALYPPEALSKPGQFPGAFLGCGFRINADGSVSPGDDPDLALGMGGFPVMLVSRSSPGRFILRRGEDIVKNQLPKVGHDPLEGEGLPLELSSHPGFGIRALSNCQFDVGPAHVVFTEMGAAEDAMRISYDGRIIATKDGAVIKVLGPSGASYETGNPLWLVRTNKKAITRYKGGSNDFIINKEGSISPAHAPNLALGCLCLGQVNDIITAEEKAHAEQQARLKPRQPNFVSRYREFQILAGIAL